MRLFGLRISGFFRISSFDIRHSAIVVLIPRQLLAQQARKFFHIGFFVELPRQRQQSVIDDGLVRIIRIFLQETLVVFVSLRRAIEGSQILTQREPEPDSLLGRRTQLESLRPFISCRGRFALGGTKVPQLLGQDGALLRDGPFLHQIAGHWPG